MKKTINLSRLAGLAVAAAMAVSYNACANTITMDLDTVLSGSFVSGDSSSKPYCEATFSDVAGGVLLTLANPGLGYAGSGSYEHINKGTGWLFNVDSSYVSQLTFTFQSMTIDQLNPKTAGTSIALPTITQGLNAYSSSAGHSFDINMAFAEADTATEFGTGKTISYLITSPVAGLNADSFNQLDSSGTLYSAAAIDDASKGLFVSTRTTETVPDAGSTSTLLGMALLGMGGLSRKFRKV